MWVTGSFECSLITHIIDMVGGVTVVGDSRSVTVAEGGSEIALASPDPSTYSVSINCSYASVSISPFEEIK